MAESEGSVVHRPVNFAGSILSLSVATMILATAGIFAKRIDLPAWTMVDARALFAVPGLVLVLWWRGRSLVLQRRGDLGWMLLCGLLLGGHWTLFFMAVRVSTVAVGLLAVFTYPVISSLVEPLVYREPLRRGTLINALLVCLGMVLVVRAWDFGDSITQGALLGVGSAGLFALRNVVSRRFARRYDSGTVMFYQLTVVAAAMAWTLPMGRWSGMDVVQWLYLMLLALGVTALGHSLLVTSFRHFSVATASVMASMQPVYATIFAWLILGEQPHWRTMLGGGIILGTVVAEALQTHGQNRKQ